MACAAKRGARRGSSRGGRVQDARRQSPRRLPRGSAARRRGRAARTGLGAVHDDAGTVDRREAQASTPRTEEAMSEERLRGRALSFLPCSWATTSMWKAGSRSPILTTARMEDRCPCSPHTQLRRLPPELRRRRRAPPTWPRATASSRPSSSACAQGPQLGEDEPSATALATTEEDLVHERRPPRPAAFLLHAPALVPDDFPPEAAVLVRLDDGHRARGVVDQADGLLLGLRLAVGHLAAAVGALDLARLLRAARHDDDAPPRQLVLADDQAQQRRSRSSYSCCRRSRPSFVPPPYRELPPTSIVYDASRPISLSRQR